MATHPNHPLLHASTHEQELLQELLPICPGYLDNVLTVFQSHHHPFILVGTLAMRWYGIRIQEQKEIDILIRSNNLQAIIDDLVASGLWEISSNYSEDKSMVNTTDVREVWLKSRLYDPVFEYLRLWPEDLYQLSVNFCNVITVPDVYALNEVLLEEEYYRDPYGLPGPPRLGSLAKFNLRVQPCIQMRAKILRRDIAIYVITIEDHLNALLDQRKLEILTKRNNGNVPEWHIRKFIRYLYLESGPVREWLMREKVGKRNQELMKQMLDR